MYGAAGGHSLKAEKVEQGIGGWEIGNILDRKRFETREAGGGRRRGSNGGDKGQRVAGRGQRSAYSVQRTVDRAFQLIPSEDSGSSIFIIDD